MIKVYGTTNGGAYVEKDTFYLILQTAMGEEQTREGRSYQKAQTVGEDSA